MGHSNSWSMVALDVREIRRVGLSLGAALGEMWGEGGREYRKALPPARGVGVAEVHELWRVRERFVLFPQCSRRGALRCSLGGR